MPELKALCMSCRDDNKKPTMQMMDTEDKKTFVVSEKNNRYSAKGKCKKCGGNVFKFLSKDDAQKFQ